MNRGLLFGKGVGAERAVPRHDLYEQAKGRHPERWSGPTRNWTPQDIVYLNPGKPAKKEVDLKQTPA